MTASAHQPVEAAQLGTWTALAGVLLILVWMLFTASRELRADWAAAPAHATTQRWAEGVTQPASLAQWQAVLAELLEAQDIRPDSPVLQETLGNVLMVGAAQAWATPEQKAQWLARAQQHYQKATVLRPADGLTWALLASAMARAGQSGPALNEAAEKALALGPNENHIQQALMLLTVEHWDKLSPRLQAWAGDLFDNGTQAQREAINRMAAPFGAVFESDKPAKQVVPRRDPGKN